MRANVFTLPPSQPFLQRLMQLLLSGQLIKNFPDENNPLSLAQATIYLPHNRACARFKELLISEGVAILPRILPLGETDNDWDLLDPNPLTYLGLEAIKPIITNEARILALSPLIKGWHKAINPQDNPDMSLFESLGLAEKLCQILDQLTTEKVSWDNLKNVKIDDKYDEYWEKSTIFLKIITEALPNFYAEGGVNDKATHRNQLLEAERLRVENSPYPVIAAGSTGSIVATRQLLKTIAHHPQGAVVLPGLDVWSDDESFKAIGRLEDEDGDHGHPQYGLKRLIEHIGVERGEGGVENPYTEQTREALIYNALRPASTTHKWHDIHQDEASFDNVTLIEAENERQEALGICIAIKSIMQDEGKTVAIVTPNRILAQKIRDVSEEFALNIDDTAGLPLNECEAMTMLRLRLKIAETTPNVIDILALAIKSNQDKALNASILRGLAPHSWAEIHERLHNHKSFQNPHKAGNRVSEADILEAIAFLTELETDIKPLIERELSLYDWINRLLPLINDKDDGAENLSEALKTLLCNEAHKIICEKHELDACLMRLLSNNRLRPLYNKQASVRLYGLPEARLNDADVVILAGLNEGSFPAQPETDAWLNRKMKYDMGVEPPERRIGLAAHDFVQAFGASSVILTRAMKQGGNPTIPSRWLQRLEAVLSLETYDKMQQKGMEILQLCEAFDKVTPQDNAKRPQPTPQREARPTAMSVTDIEKLVRDPYAIYAKHVLKLTPLDEFDLHPDARERGTLIHAIFQQYEAVRAKGKPRDPKAAIMEIAAQTFAPLMNDVVVEGLWFPRFEKLADAFLAWDEKAREEGAQVYFEVTGEIAFTLSSEREFRLKARADRLQVQHKSTAIYDYKTGKIATDAQIAAFNSPQLPLTALIVNKGGFSNLPPSVFTGEMAHISIKGMEETLNPKQYKGDMDELLSQSWSQLTDMLEAYEDEAFPYLSKAHPEFVKDRGDYDLLARVKEWQQADESEEAADE